MVALKRGLTKVFFDQVEVSAAAPFAFNVLIKHF